MNDINQSKDLVEKLKSRGIEPNESFVAAAGWLHGFARAWKIASGLGLLVEYGWDGCSNCTILMNEPFALSEWLHEVRYDKTDVFHRILLDSNICGRRVGGADSSVEGPRYVVRTRRFTGVSLAVSEFVTVDGFRDSEPLRFAGPAEAQEWIEAQDRNTLCDYTVVVV